MSGRFLTPSYLVAVVLVSRLMPSKPALCGATIFATVILGSVSLVSPLRVSGDYYEGEREISTDGIVDERGFYVKECGLWRVVRNRGEIQHVWAILGRKWRDTDPVFAMIEALGLVGYFVGPDVHLVGRYGLSDAFLSRLPASGLDWRPGHYTRSFPRGYVETLWKNENRIKDSGLAAFYDKISLVVRADFLAPGRLSTIAGLNFGFYDSLTAPMVERCRGIREATWDEVTSIAGVNAEAGIDELVTAADGFLRDERSDLAYLVWSTAFDRRPDDPDVLDVCNRIGQRLIATDVGMFATETLMRCVKNGKGDPSSNTPLPLGISSRRNSEGLIGRRSRVLPRGRFTCLPSKWSPI